MAPEYLPVIFFFIALFYSSVGFGGGSSYLAVLSLLFTDFYEIRSTALLLNINVVAVGTIIFIRHRIFHFRLFWPFLVLSMPMAYLGSQLDLSQKAFFLILGFSLVASGIFLMLRFIGNKVRPQELGLSKKLTIGGLIGLLSGVSGIGGGIFLSPMLNLLNWQNARTVSALASFFILVNSIAGLIGLVVSDTLQFDSEPTIKLMVAVFFGACLGSYLSGTKINVRFIGVLTAILVTYVGLRLVLHHWLAINI